MNISDLLAPDAIVPNLKAKTKSQLLRKLAACGNFQTRLPEKRILECLIEGERLGTTGVGQGIAIPHSRISGADKITGVFAKLENAVDYEAVDSRPVDLVFMLLAPENSGIDPLKALARISHLLRDQAICAKLRGSSSANAIYSILTENMGVRRATLPDFLLFGAGS